MPDSTDATPAAWSVLLRFLEQERSHGGTHVWLSPEARGVMREWHTTLRGGGAKRPAASSAGTGAKPAPPSAAPPLPAAPERKATPEEVIRELFTANPASPKLAPLEEVKQGVLACPDYAAAIAAESLRPTMVFATGNPDSPLVFVGEAPGAEEEKLGEPFVGPAGQLLTKILNAMGLQRSQVYITNIVKHRPLIPGGPQGPKNRKPTPEEIAVGLPHLVRELEVLQPRVIVALGGTALEGLTGKPGSITALRGKFLKFRGIPLMPTFHPSYLLRNDGLEEKRKVWEDMLQVMELLGIPITEKQKRFFRVA